MDVVNLNLKLTHKITYEVMRKHFCVSETVGTFESYNECLEIFKSTFEDSRHASIDLVVRDGTGVLVFRKPLIEIDDCKDGKELTYSDPYGWFGIPSVYNSDYKNFPNGGFEFYTKPTKTYSEVD